MMKKKSIGGFIIASTIIWGAVIIGCALKLDDTSMYEEISFILYGGVIFHLIFIWGTLAVQLKARKEKKPV
jgi:hypothetical protein